MTGKRRPFRVVITKGSTSGGDYLWGTYETVVEADAIAKELRVRGEDAQVRTYKRDKGKR